MKQADNYPELSLLGHKADYEFNYRPQVLEAFANEHLEYDYFVDFICPEFTTLCPVTGQPDFATIKISYIPDQKMVESKSLKLYLFSYRNHPGFHESSVNTIMRDLIALLQPKYLEVQGIFTARGGIAIHPYCNYGMPHTKYQTLAQDRLYQHRAA